MSLDRVLFSSASEHWATPKDLLVALDAEFRFDFDPCPLGAFRQAMFAVAGTDGLALSWAGRRVYCNPPYGRGVGDWLAKAPEAVLAVFLLPARTDTRWWHEHALKATEIRFLRGRLRFGEAKNSAPFPSVLLIYRNETRTETPKET